MYYERVLSSGVLNLALRIILWGRLRRELPLGQVALRAAFIVVQTVGVVSFEANRI